MFKPRIRAWQSWLGSPLPPSSCLYHEKGFQGFCLQDVTIVQAKKKPPGGDLTPPEKATNRRMSSIPSPPELYRSNAWLLIVSRPVCQMSHCSTPSNN